MNKFSIFVQCNDCAYSPGSDCIRPDFLRYEDGALVLVDNYKLAEFIADLWEQSEGGDPLVAKVIESAEPVSERTMSISDQLSGE